MTIQLKRPPLIWAVLLCIVLVNGFMAISSVDHAEHHADHQASTHSTGICAWLCAAGQGIESTSITLNSTIHLIERTVVLRVDPTLDPVFFHRFFRGPPGVLS